MAILLQEKYIFCIIIVISSLCNANSNNTEDVTSVQEADEKQSLKYFTEDNLLGAQWPHGIVPYYLNTNDYDVLVAQRVRMAMNNLEDSSCLKFKAINGPNHFAPWLHISNPSKIRDCVHLRENKTDLEIPVVLGYECLHKREILHTLMHAIGFKDEVTHPQRDQYVRIQWENINPKYHQLFRVRYQDFAPVYIEYDPTSIMHFHDRAFSKNGQATIAPLLPGLVIGSSGDLSSLDKMRLRYIFGHECNKRRVGDLLDTCKIVMRENTNDYLKDTNPDISNDPNEQDPKDDGGNDENNENNYKDNDNNDKNDDNNDKGSENNDNGDNNDKGNENNDDDDENNGNIDKDDENNVNIQNDNRGTEAEALHAKQDDNEADLNNENDENNITYRKRRRFRNGKYRIV